MIRRSLPYIQQAGTEWRNEKKCVSCHRTTFTTWSLNRAAEAGLDVDRTTLQDWNQWSREWTSHVAEKRRDQADRESTLLAENDSVAQLLLGRPVNSNQTTGWAAEYRNFLIQAQNDNGSWKAGGQLPLQKRPKRETQEVSTMWALLALHDFGLEHIAPAPVTEAATVWLGDQTTGVSTEWWSARLLLLTASGKTKAAEVTRQKLLQYRNEDGGWGWLTDSDSDALGTGIALYALSQDHARAAIPEVSRSLLFLQRTQDADGSWPVNGTKKNSAATVTDTATYWGTCWAVIALTEFIDPPSSDSATHILKPDHRVTVP